MHELLRQQIERHLGKDAADGQTPDPALTPELLEAISTAYEEADEERRRLRDALDAVANLVPSGGASPTRANDRAAEELEASMSLLWATLEATADAILAVDGQGEVSSFNQRFVELWDLTPAQIRSGGSAKALEAPGELVADRDAFLARLLEISQAPDSESFDILELEDGRVVERSSQPRRLAGEPAGRVWSFREVTEKRRLEEEVRQAQKMEAIGRLAGGIAHDFNNLLTVITGYCDLCQLAVGKEGMVARHLAEIARASKRAADLTAQLLAFSRRQVLEHTAVDLNRLVRELRGVYGHLLGVNVRLRLELRGDPATVLADPSGIQQILLNLLINARDAMPQGGPISVVTGNLEVVSGAAAGPFPGELEPGRYVTLRVQDTGHGIALEDRHKIFDPFFTTKDAGKGTGLGLSVVYGIVKQSGGAIRVDSQIGWGTEFLIALPEAPRLQEEAPAVETHKVRRGGGLILVVEDDDPVRRIVAEVLATEGHRVEAVASPAEAEARFEELEGVDLLLTDIVMRGSSGVELARRLQAAEPGLRVLFMSGYAARDQSMAELSPDSTGFLQKPFDSEVLLQKVEEMVRPPSGSGDPG